MNTKTARDYPHLSAWLDRHNGRQLWVAETPHGNRIEAWQMHGGRGILVEIHPGGHGWDLWTNADTIQIDETLADAERRVGLFDAAPDVEYHVATTVTGDPDAAMVAAMTRAMARGDVVLDVVVWSEDGARAYGGDDAVDRYREDPEASVFERFEIRVNAVGRVP
jgi:hypothetical protein